MKKIGKVLALVLALVMVLTCASACSKKDDNILKMATNAEFPPYEFVKDKKIVGIDAEIAAEIAKKLGMELEISDVQFDSILAGVQTGKYDIGMAGMTVTEERKQSVDFSDVYAHAVQVVIVREDSPYTSFEEFYTGFDADGNPTGVKDNIKIGAQNGTTGYIYASDEPAKWGFGEQNVVPYDSGADAVAALNTNKITAVIIDNEPAKAFVAANKGLKILEGAYAEEDYAIAVAKGNPELLKKINQALKELKEDGTLDKIVKKYIPAE